MRDHLHLHLPRPRTLAGDAQKPDKERARIGVVRRCLLWRRRLSGRRCFVLCRLPPVTLLPCLAAGCDGAEHRTRLRKAHCADLTSQSAHPQSYTGHLHLDAAGFVVGAVRLPPPCILRTPGHHDLTRRIRVGWRPALVLWWPEPGGCRCRAGRAFRGPASSLSSRRPGARPPRRRGLSRWRRARGGAAGPS